MCRVLAVECLPLLARRVAGDLKLSYRLGSQGWLLVESADRSWNEGE